MVVVNVNRGSVIVVSSTKHHGCYLLSYCLVYVEFGLVRKKYLGDKIKESERQLPLRCCVSRYFSMLQRDETALLLVSLLCVLFVTVWSTRLSVSTASAGKAWALCFQS